jgi:hypothetical protein
VLSLPGAPVRHSPRGTETSRVTRSGQAGLQPIREILKDML